MRPSRASLIVTVLFAACTGTSSALASGESRESSGGGATAGQTVITPEVGPFRLNFMPQPPPLSLQEQQKLQHFLDKTHLPTPLPGPDVGEAPGALTGPAGPPTEPGEYSPDTGVMAPGSFAMPRNSDLGAGAPTNRTSVINEPSVASAGQVVFQTGNWYAALSTDGGNTFGYVDPGSAFPSVNGGFCCDQIAIYDASRNVIFWLLQYIKDATSGTQRIAVDRGANGTFDCYYDFNPQLFGFPSGRWLDFPDLVLVS